MKKIIISIIGVLFVVAAIVAYVAYNAVMAPVVQSEDTVYIQVRPDDNTQRVGEMLTSAAEFKTMAAFAPLMEHYEYDRRVKPGNYAIRPGDSMRDICLRLLSGNQTPVKLVVPSVRTLDRLAGAVGKQLMADSAAVMDLLTNKHYLDSLGYSSATAPCMFIPNTYEVYWTMTPDQLFARMHKEYQRFWNEERLAKAKNLGFSPTEIATIASIIASETNKKEEYPTIASIYINRLRRGIALQACPTVIFATGDFTLRRVLKRHLKIDSPYNTYKYRGLPPGPIRLVRPDIIDAVLNSPKTDYLYMCANPDFSGTHIFSSTYTKHSSVARDYQRALNERDVK